METDVYHERAIVRGVPDTFDRCIKPRGEDRPIDVERARGQHERYCSTLASLGLELIRLDADNRCPDCCFVEDTVVAGTGWVVVCRMGAQSRRGEEADVADALSEGRLYRMEAPATMDGGDVIADGDTLYVGLSGRTNEAAVRWLRSVLAAEGVDVVPVTVHGALHLKSACTPVAPGVFLVWDSLAGEEAFAGSDKLIVPVEERYAANCLSVGGTIVVSDGYPRTRELIESRGYRTRPIPMSEFCKAGGSLTCLSVLL